LVDPVTKRRRDVYLGRYGTPESRREYDRVVADWMAGGRRLESPAGGAGAGMSVAELLTHFWRHVDEDYPPESPERKNFTAPLRLLRESYAHTPAAEFDVLKLKALRTAMVKRGWCRNRINREVGRVKTCFKWAAGEKLVPGKVYFDLAVLRALWPNAPGVKHSVPRRPAYLSDAEPALQVMRPAAADLVRLIALTGARPSELLTIRMKDIDRNDPDLWRYVPGSDAGPYGRHKNAWRGQPRVIALGPRCIQVLRPWLREDDRTAHFFSPAATIRQWNQARRERRKTPLTPSALARYARRARPGCRKRAGTALHPLTPNRRVTGPEIHSTYGQGARPSATAAGRRQAGNRHADRARAA
jgi:integrase